MRIPPFRLRPEPLDDEARMLPKFRDAEPDVGTRHRLGGDPELDDGERWPLCSVCGRPMTFLAQIDSINDTICIADAGMIYVFVCLDDFTVAAEVHAS